ncbi:MAG TPA: hypothetical protein EYH16_01825 [Leucothrix mucor]|nr:hypothetical protein [Leucothrix mucor]
MKNPYESPKSKVVDGKQRLDPNVHKKSKIPSVVGIILLVLSVFGIFGLLMSLGMLFYGNEELMNPQGFSRSYLIMTMVLGLISSLWTIYFSILLIKYRDKGRKQYNYFMMYLVVSLPLTHLYRYLFEPQNSFSAVGSQLVLMLMTILISFSIYGLFWYLLNKENTLKALN